MATREQLITAYFSEGYSYPLIICFLFFEHGISLSLRQLKMILARLNLSRRRTITMATITRAVTLIQVSRL